MRFARRFAGSLASHSPHLEVQVFQDFLLFLWTCKCLIKNSLAAKNVCRSDGLKQHIGWSLLLESRSLVASCLIVRCCVCTVNLVSQNKCCFGTISNVFAAFIGNKNWNIGRNPNCLFNNKIPSWNTLRYFLLSNFVVNNNEYFYRYFSFISNKSCKDVRNFPKQHLFVTPSWLYGWPSVGKGWLTCSTGERK